MRAREDREADHMSARLARRFDDLGGREPDAVVDHFDSGIARAHRDLLGAVRMAVEAGLADHEGEAAPKPPRHAVDVGAQAVEPLRGIAGGTAHPRRPAALALNPA